MGSAPKQLGHLVIRVRDLEKAEDFYTRVVGLTVMAKFEGNALFMSANTDLSHELAVFCRGQRCPWSGCAPGWACPHGLADGFLRRPEGVISAPEGQ